MPVSTILPPAPRTRRYVARGDRPRALILAAGGSTRMGAPKGLLRLDGRPLILAHIAAFEAAGLSVRVVLGAHADAYRAVLPDGVEVVENPAWATTDMAASLAIGLGGLARALVHPVDVPPPAADTLRALLALPGDAVPTWAGSPGHPVRLDGPLAPGQRLDARLAGARRVAVADPDCVRNLNTPGEWAAFLDGR